MTNMIKTEDSDYLHNHSEGITHHADTVAEYRETYGNGGIRNFYADVYGPFDNQSFQDSTVSLPLIM